MLVPKNVANRRQADILAACRQSTSIDAAGDRFTGPVAIFLAKE
jgi:hypothetical protein